MNEIKKYNAENLDKLKLWLTNMATEGYTKYYEILVDGTRVVNKTEKPEEFDSHERWMDESSQSIRVLIYNTKNSHRSQVFEFRTLNYIEGVSGQVYPTRKPKIGEAEIDKRVQQALAEEQRKQADNDQKKQTAELKQRLAQAEEFIQELESQLATSKTEKSSLDVGSLFNLLTGLAKSNPLAGENLDGLKTMFKQEAGSTSEENTEASCSFKRKVEQNDTTISRDETENKNNPARGETNTEKTNEDLYIKIPRLNLNEDQSKKVSEFAEFLVRNPDYIETVHGLLKNEEAVILGKKI